MSKSRKLNQGDRWEAGVSAVEYLIVLVVIAVMYFAAWMFDSAKTAKAEIDRQNYDDLASIAQVSCAGTEYLAHVVNKGPITRADFEAIRRNLGSMATQQERSDARNKILGKALECARS